MARWGRRLIVGAGVVLAAGLAAVACLAPERSFLYHPGPRGEGPGLEARVELPGQQP